MFIIIVLTTTYTTLIRSGTTTRGRWLGESLGRRNVKPAGARLVRPRRREVILPSHYRMLRGKEALERVEGALPIADVSRRAHVQQRQRLPYHPPWVDTAGTQHVESAANRMPMTPASAQSNRRQMERRNSDATSGIFRISGQSDGKDLK
eukprot:2590960-Pyramimonas_sp.AAC.1